MCVYPVNHSAASLGGTVAANESPRCSLVIFHSPTSNCRPVTRINAFNYLNKSDSENLLAEQDTPTASSRSTQDVEEKPAPLDDDFNAGTPAKSGDSGRERGETEETLMTEEQIDTFFRETIAKLTSPEERENIKANVSLSSLLEHLSVCRNVDNDTAREEESRRLLFQHMHIACVHRRSLSHKVPWNMAKAVVMLGMR